MTTKTTRFDAVAFVRRVRDKQAALLKGKSPDEILAFFSAYGKKRKRHIRSVRAQGRQSLKPGFVVPRR